MAEKIRPWDFDRRLDRTLTYRSDIDIGMLQGPKVMIKSQDFALRNSLKLNLLMYICTRDVTV